MSADETEDERAKRLLTRQEQSNLPKRFYKSVTVSGSGNSWQIALDDRPVKTPLKRQFTMPSKDMAEAVAAEWDAQQTHIDPSSMILTKLANTAVDRVLGDEARIVAEIVHFAASDMVCYRAGQPEKLVQLQADSWDPVLAWAAREMDCKLICVTGIVHQDQPEASLARLGQALEKEDAFRLTAIHNLTTLTGSTLVGMMVAAGSLEAGAGWQAAHVDEDFQISQWGEDEEARQRRALRKADYDATAQFLALAGA